MNLIYAGERICNKEICFREELINFKIIEKCVLFSNNLALTDASSRFKTKVIRLTRANFIKISKKYLILNIELLVILWNSNQTKVTICKKKERKGL